MQLNIGFNLVENSLPINLMSCFHSLEDMDINVQGDKGNVSMTSKVASKDSHHLG